MAAELETRSWVDRDLDAKEACRVRTVVGRYLLGPCIGSGGMGVVKLGLMRGAAGFSRFVALKRLHPEYSQSRAMIARFKREIWLSARIQHPNVVQVLDVIQHDDELLLVMEYVDGETLRSLGADAAARGKPIPLAVAAGVLVPALHGLHAAHEARDDSGNLLGLVHCDFSPQNVLISPDGHVKTLDFGVAKAAIQDEVTRSNHISGKLGYLSPEQALERGLDARSDVFAAGTVLWETVVGARLFRANEAPAAAVLSNLLYMEIPPPSRLRPDVPAALDHVIMRALERDCDRRFQSAKELAVALEQAIAPAPPCVVGACLKQVCQERLRQRESLLASFRESLTRSPTFDLTDAVLFGGSEDTRDGLSGSLDARLAPSEVAPRKSSVFRSRVLWGTLAVACVAVAALRFSWQHAHRNEQLLRPSAEGTDLLPTAEARHSAPPPVVDAAPSQQASALGPSAAPATSGAARVLRTPRRPIKPSRAKNNAVPKPRCDPPTIVDAAGIRHFRPECL